MAGPGDELAARGAGRGHLRASHADRDRVIGTLKTAYVQGMLDKDEFDLRVGQTLASRTYADLAALTADLPAGLAPARSPKPARAHGGQPILRPGRVITAATALYGGAWAYELFLAPGGINNPSAGPLILGGFLVYFGVLIVCIGAILISRQDRRAAGQPPRRPDGDGPASRRLPPAGPGAPFRPADGGHGHTAEAAGRPRTRPARLVRGQPGICGPATAW
jgi:hypothetical protein